MVMTPPAKHMILVDALSRLSPGGSRDLPQEVPSPLIRPDISDRCTGCGMCATFCPTGALKSAYREDGFVEVTLEPQRCTGCNLCADTCYRDAVTVGRYCGIPEDNAEPEVLWRGQPASHDSLVREWATKELLLDGSGAAGAGPRRPPAGRSEGPERASGRR